MSGQALNRGGVRVEWHADIDSPAFRWQVRMRNHDGRGPSAEAAFDQLVAGIEDELTAAKAARETYLATARQPEKPE